MSYSQFTMIDQVISAFDLALTDRPHLFAQTPSIAASTRLREALEETLDLGSTTDRRSSELIITPILLEVRRIFKGQISYFSGTTFDVDASVGLNGICDFMLSGSDRQSLITAPVLTMC